MSKQEVDNKLQGVGLAHDDHKKICSLINSFGAKSLSKLVTSKTELSNVFISPLSVAEPLAAIINGANEETKNELKQVLHLSEIRDLNVINNFFSRINMFLKSSPYADVAIANSLWLSWRYKVYAHIEKSLTEFFDMQLMPLKSANEINTWVADATKGRITNIMDNIPPYLKMVLINAIYFKGLFAEQFKESLTQEAAFFSSKGQTKVHMMQQSRNFMYSETSNYQAVKLDYKSERGESTPKFVSVVVLPHQGKMPEVLELMKEDFGLFTDNFTRCHGTLFMPRFKLEYSTMLNENLKSLGLTKGFKAGDFNSLAAPGDLYIDSIIHKTFLEVNEKGTEAAAVTAVKMRALAHISVEKEFMMRVDRPFVFAIQEQHTGLVLFAGVIDNISS